MLKIRNRVILLLLVVIFLCPFLAFTQEKENGIDKVTEKVKGLVFHHPGDTIMDKKSEVGYKQYQGKIIRKITIQHVGFERNIHDTTRYRVVNSITRVANSLHTNTKERVIRNNLFIWVNKPLDPYRLADNERYLRDLDFILDARIVVKPIRGNHDMVDVVVMTRDVFSLGGSFTPKSRNSGRIDLYDANLSGWGQRTEFRNLIDTDRDPKYGIQLLYSKNSIKGSLINATVSYSQINTGVSYGLENENALFLKLDRPLVSAYTRWAGGMQLSRNWSVNTFSVIDTSFRSYTYYVKDFWVGYNIGIKKHTENRNRHFIGIRTFGQSFSHQPIQNTETDKRLYNNQTYVLGSFTFYNQNFYRTKYIYGFGRTEDVPYGRRLTLLAGQVKQLGYHRTYVGAEFDKSVFRKNGDFREYSLRAGSYKNGDGLEDITILASASLFSKLLKWKSFKARQSVGLSYTTILKQTIASTPLRIDNEFGLDRFEADSLLGSQRLNLTLETVVFTKPTLLGFHFAPFIFINTAMIARKDQTLFNQKPYFALGGGVRTRNENLIFGTIELRMFYFPRVTEDLSHFKITVSSNLRIKYSSGFVRAPAFIRYN
jgi:hypothetical protein